MPFFTASISRRNHLKRARIAKAILRDATSHNRTKSRLRLFRARAVLFAANLFSARCASSRSVFCFIGNEKFPIKKQKMHRKHSALASCAFFLILLRHSDIISCYAVYSNVYYRFFCSLYHLF